MSECQRPSNQDRIDRIELESLQSLRPFRRKRCTHNSCQNPPHVIQVASSPTRLPTPVER